ncbi:SDR family oxidoreductase [Flammeovirga aprica]|uniref:SDR family oxidoreductase n=1 Tax=Flammeovirga aprica JL-4 TaxID=694437 RepID=A0A7X9XCJ3_9BACT|nr:SDR family oxidoreductase [Flammeovirga aprica]NME71699.1 SDR family oxidoreductase [Flammeovirga aprica JL-4]
MNVLVAGATGYLGQYLVKELQNRGHNVRVLIRKEHQKELFNGIDDFFIGEVTQPKSLQGITDNIDWVFSTIGITRQKDGMTYMDVDFQGNMNLLHEAKQTQVKSFLYVSAIGGDQLRFLKIFEAKEKFVDALKNSGLDYTIMRPNGFFSDMTDFLEMAKGGTVYLFGNGEYKINPIHGEDLAKVCVDKIMTDEKEVQVGGPVLYTQNELAEVALKAWGKKVKIIHLPDWIRRIIISVVRTFTSSKVYGPIEFFLTLMAFDNIADQYGTHYLEDFFHQKVKEI